jgi:hypothetical protein
MDTSETVWFLLGCALVVGYLALVVYIAWDLLRRDLPGWHKVAWVGAFFIFPLLSVLFYAVVRGDDPRPYPSLGRGAPRL